MCIDKVYAPQNRTPSIRPANSILQIFNHYSINLASRVVKSRSLSTHPARTRMTPILALLRLTVLGEINSPFRFLPVFMYSTTSSIGGGVAGPDESIVDASVSVLA